MIRSLLLAMTAAFLPVTLQAQEVPSQESFTIEGIAAVVNDEPITWFDVRQRARLLLLGIGIETTPEIIQQVSIQALDQLIDEHLQLQEARQYEVVIEDSEIAEAVGEMASRSGADRDVLYAQLLQGGINPVSLEEQMRAEIAWRRIMAGLYGSRIRVSRNQIDSKLEQLKASAENTQFQLGEIFLYAATQEEQAEAMAFAVNLVAHLRQGGSFEAAAQQLSSAPTAATGGNMGWVSTEDIDPSAFSVLDAMTQPGITDPIAVENGIYIYLLRSKQTPQDQSVLVNLRQIVATDGSQETLRAALDEISNCDGIDAVADASENLTAITLGRIDENILNLEMKTRVEATATGEASEIFQSGSGQAVLFVCDRETTDSSLPTRQQIEDRIYSEHLGMISDRALRNIKRDATIIRRDQ